MASTTVPRKYKDDLVQGKHSEVHSPSRLLRPIEPVLPPGISQKVFDSAITKLVSHLGAEAVFVGDALADYIDPYELWEVEGNRKVPSAAVTPSSVEQIQGVIAIAREFKIPLWTFSRGKNLGYGGPAPRVSGSIAMDLHRMNKVIEVNEKFAYAVVEPGVTFFDLYNHCAKNKLRVWPSVAALGWGSVLGNTVDRGLGFTPTANHHQHIAGLEVVLGNGEVVRTGQFAMTNSPVAHMSKYSFGPSIEGLFLQSNLGIVTKLGIWLTPQPQAYMACGIDVAEFDDLATLVDLLGPMKRNGTLPFTSIYLNNILELTAPLVSRQHLWSSGGRIPDSRIKEMMKEFDLGYWHAQFGLYGPKAVIQAQFDEVKKIFAKSAPTALARSQLFSGASEDDLVDALSVPGPAGGIFVGIPNMEVLPLVSYRLQKDKHGIPAHGDYSVLIPSNGKDVLEWVKTAKAIHDREDFDFFCNFNIHERHVLGVHLMAYDKSDAAQRASVNRIWWDLHPEAAKRGYGSYRCHVNYMEPLAELYDFNNHALRKFLETLKDTVDPDGILSPGKMGIWPQRLRAEKQKL